MVKGSGIGETKKLLRSCLVSDPEEPAAADGWADSISKLEQWNTVVHPNNSVRVPQTHFLDPPEVRNAAGAMLGATGLGTGGGTGLKASCRNQRLIMGAENILEITSSPLTPLQVQLVL